MCYSPQASFTSAVILSGLGVVTLKKHHKKKQILLALYPVFFAIQQFAEGIVWLDLDAHHIGSVIGKYVFLFFALLLWPVWVGISLAAIEKNPDRKKIMYGVSAVGAFISVYLFILALANQGIESQLLGGHLAYMIPFPYEWVMHVGKFLYLACILVPFMASTFKPVWILGTLNALGFIYANYLPLENLISVWCFIAALASISIYFILSIQERIDSRTA